MLAEPRWLTGFEKTLPRRPYVSEDPRLYGICIRPKRIAIRSAYLQVNPPWRLNFLAFDVDRIGAAFAAYDAGLPPPTYIVLNQKSGHAHFLYQLEVPVRRDRNSAALLAEEYLRASLAARPQQPELRLFLSRLEAGHEKVSAGLIDATKIVRDYPSYQFSELPKELWSLLFPQNFWSFVQRQARANRLDPYLVMGLIRQESAFNVRATSSANAHGLMQVLPTTASRSKRASRIRSAGVRLYNATYNIRFGCAYLRTLLNEFNGKPEPALAAYNAWATSASKTG